mmetsp:Transcript_16557/g.24906  ORF Transcript_16557/g.24906 Transcript_16557/m.24906 type:complete len:195 (-) Transcript_16557:146-730(-)
MYAGEGSFPHQIPDVSKIDINKLTRGSSEPDFIPNPTPVERDYYRQGVFNAGSLWLSGMFLGGLYGGYDGYKSAPGKSMRIISNSVLNGISKQGAILGNRLAVISMLHTMYTGAGDAFFEDWLPRQIPHTPSDYTVPIFSGVATGSSFLFGFNHKNPRVYLLGAAIGGALSCAYWFGGSYVYNTIIGTKSRRRY